MRKTFSASMILLVAALLLVGCTRDEPTRTSTTTPKVTSSELENRIKATLDQDPNLRVADIKVNADADENRVTLKGTVESESARMRAVEAAKSSHPGIVVEDKIDVKPRELSRAEYTTERATEERSKAKDLGERIGDSVDDAWIHSKIVAKLIGNSATPERKINVDVDNQVVTLRGTVDSVEARREAELVAKETEGVKKVINLIKVGKSSQR